jgi:hypothetical protein
MACSCHFSHNGYGFCPHKHAPWQVWEASGQDDCTPCLTNFFAEVMVFFEAERLAVELPRVPALHSNRALDHNPAMLV